MELVAVFTFTAVNNVSDDRVVQSVPYSCEACQKSNTFRTEKKNIGAEIEKPLGNQSICNVLT